MLVAFFESVKYIGHLIPVSFLRIFLGYFYLGSAWQKFSGDFLNKPKLASNLAEILNSQMTSEWSRQQIENFLIPNWQSVAFLFNGFEFAVAVSYLIGFVVRPTALMAATVCFVQLSFAPSAEEPFFRLLVATHLTMAWVGAGRCLGVDYYFFKRRRGLWW